MPLLDPAVEALDEFHYIPVAGLNRLNDYTYALGKNQMRLADDSADDGIVRHSEHVAGDFFRGIVGVDYMLASGDNDLYIATGDGTKPFGRIAANNPYSSSTRSVVPVNDHFSADRDGNLIISFGTKEQAAGLQGILFGGDLELPAALDDFKTVAYVGPTDENGKRLPLDEDGRIAETTAETALEATKATEKPARTGSTQKPGATGQVSGATGASQTGGATGEAKTAGESTGKAQASADKSGEAEDAAQSGDAAQSTNGSGTDRTKGSKTSAGTDRPKSEQAADQNHSAASTEAGTAASSTAAESTTEADKPHGTIPGVVEIPADSPRETSEGKHVLTEEERLAILDRIKTSEAANG